MNKQYKIWLPLLFSLVMVIGMFIGYKMRDAMPGKSFFYNQKRNTLQEITDLIKNRYVDTVNVNAITDSAIETILNQLDPHSVYIPAQDVQQINDDIKGSFYGLGVEYNIIKDSLNVINVLEAGPADKAGLQTGDILLKAGDSILSGKKISAESIRNILRGQQGSKLKISFFRNNKIIVTEVQRGTIPVKSVDAAYKIDSITGYIKINKFSTQTYKEFMNNLLTLKKDSMQQLIIDLRGNGGGVLDEAVEIADELLAGDKLITYTEGAHATKKEFRCRRQGQFEQGKVIILANEGSASASEVLMGALQDWDRATIIGRQSFGKGLVQEQYDLANGAALRLTIARYYTPIGRSIQRSYKNGNRAYYDDVTNRYHNGQLFTTDSIKNDTTKIYKSQNGKKLYGGGGISPDYFVSADTTKMSYTSAQLYTKGTLTNFGYNYFKQNKVALNSYKTATQFIRNFKISDRDWQYFETQAAQDSINIKSIQLKEKIYVENILKAAIARQLFKTDGYYQSLNADDSFIKKAMDIFYLK